MTVCVAVINRGTIIGASDRMITAGDIEFEPASMHKATQLTPSIVAMWAGDAGYQREVLEAVGLHLRDSSRPLEGWTVREITELYAREWIAAKHRRAVLSVLHPLGLEAEQLTMGNHGLSDTLVRELMIAVSQFQMPGEAYGITETIIAGIDRAFPNGQPGSQLYKLSNENYVCANATAFAAIGAGSWHANSHLMLARYDPLFPEEEALWLTYVAKRRAEVAPGVGSSATNMFAVGSTPVAINVLPSEWMERLDREYAAFLEAERETAKQPIARIRNWLDEMRGQNTTTETATQLPPSDPGNEQTSTDSR